MDSPCSPASLWAVPRCQGTVSLGALRGCRAGAGCSALGSGSFAPPSGAQRSPVQVGEGCLAPGVPAVPLCLLAVGAPRWNSVSVAMSSLCRVAVRSCPAVSPRQATDWCPFSSRTGSSSLGGWCPSGVRSSLRLQRIPAFRYLSLLVLPCQPGVWAGCSRGALLGKPPRTPSLGLHSPQGAVPSPRGLWPLRQTRWQGPCRLFTCVDPPPLGSMVGPGSQRTLVMCDG